MATVAQIEKYLDTLEPNARKNVKIVTPGELGQTHLFHISTNKSINEFIPSVTRRASNFENRNIPRISTSTSLIGAMLGYSAIQADFVEDITAGTYVGGWYIYDWQSVDKVNVSGINPVSKSEFLKYKKMCMPICYLIRNQWFREL